MLKYIKINIRNFSGSLKCWGESLFVISLSYPLLIFVFILISREEVIDLESKIKVHESAIHALKDQISYFKSKARDSDKLSEEVVKLKNSIKDMESVQLAINGTREQVNEMLRNENNIESMAILAATLKK